MQLERLMSVSGPLHKNYKHSMLFMNLTPRAKHGRRQYERDTCYRFALVGHGLEE